MSEVQRFWSHEASNIRCVREADFDRVTAERDAALADLASASSDKEAYAQNAIDLRKRVDALQQRLTAADERAAFITGLMIRCAHHVGDGADKYIMRDINHYLATGSTEAPNRRIMDLAENNPGFRLSISADNVKVSGHSEPHSVTKITYGEGVKFPMPDTDYTVTVAPVKGDGDDQN